MIFANRISGIFVSFLIGSAVGGAIALLYAPESGKRLRGDISKKTNSLIKEGKKKSNELWNDAKEKAESTLDSANNFLNSNVEKIVNETGKVKDALTSGINAYNKERKS
jgi:gas vesicle protein